MSQKIYSNLDIKGNAKIGDITNATSDTDKFLVSDAGVVKYRTGSEMLSDLGVAPGVASNIQHQVKAGVAISKGQAVYVTGADGTNMIVGLASNSAESTSSKTMGLMASTVATNGFGNVIAEGLLAGLDTSTANAGDPVWLGTNGNLIYGLANKPSAPNHLVFIGIVTRANANNGEIFVKVQNGFELNEIHDVDTKTAAPVGNDILAFEGAPVNLWKNKTIASVLGYTPVSQSRTLTINGTTFDLSADRSWTIASGVTSFNTRTGAITLTSGDVTGALGYTPYNATNPNGYISSYTETDPTVPSHVKSITTTEKSNWNTAFGWGNHSGLYMTQGQTRTDINSINNGGNRYDPSVNNPTNEHYAVLTYGNGGNVTGQLATHFVSGNLYSRGYNSTWSSWRRYWNDTDFTNSNISNWNTAYSWGNHASAGYLTSVTNISGNAGTATQIYQDNEPVSGTYRLLLGNASDTTGYAYNFNSLYFNRANNTIQGANISGNAATATNADYANAAGTANSVPWANLTGKPTLLQVNGNNNTLNGAVVDGTTYWAAGAGDAPTTYGSLLTVTGGIGWYNQLGFGTNDTMYFRQSINNTTNWTAWKTILNSSNYTSYAVPTSRTITINGTSYDLSANRSWTVTASETDTLATVTSRGNTTSSTITAERYRGNNSLVLNSYTTVNPSSNVFLYSQPNDRDSWLYLDSADTGSNWGIYHRQIDSAISGLEGNAIGFIGGGNSALKAFIGLSTGNGYFANNLTVGANLTIASLSSNDGMIENNTGAYFHLGGWGVGRTAATAILVNTAYRADIADNATNAGYATSAGSASSSTRANYLDPNYIGGQQLNPQTYFNNGIGVKVAMTASANYWNDTLWINGYTGGDVPWMCALHTQRNSSPRMYISAQQHTSSSYGTLYEFWTNYNMDAPNKAGTSYYQTNTWMQMNGAYGLYWPNNNGTHIHSNDGSTYTQVRIQGSKNGYGGIFDSHSGVNGFMYDGSGNGGAYREANGRWYFYHHIGNNCTGISTSTTSGSYRAYIGGSLYAEGDIVAYSDRRKKENIVTVDNALDTVNKLRGVYYNRIDDDSKRRQVGVIAQEIQEVLPEVVTYAEDIDEYGVSYGNIAGLLIEAIKEQQTQIEELKQLVDKLIKK